MENTDTLTYKFDEELGHYVLPAASERPKYKTQRPVKKTAAVQQPTAESVEVVLDDSGEVVESEPVEIQQMRKQMEPEVVSEPIVKEKIVYKEREIPESDIKLKICLGGLKISYKLYDYRITADNKMTTLIFKDTDTFPELDDTDKIELKLEFDDHIIECVYLGHTFNFEGFQFMVLINKI